MRETNDEVVQVVGSLGPHILFEGAVRALDGQLLVVLPVVAVCVKLVVVPNRVAIIGFELALIANGGVPNVLEVPVISVTLESFVRSIAKV